MEEFFLLHLETIFGELVIRLKQGIVNKVLMIRLLVFDSFDVSIEKLLSINYHV